MGFEDSHRLSFQRRKVFLAMWGLETQNGLTWMRMAETGEAKTTSDVEITKEIAR